jgi:hypothetical protein
MQMYERIAANEDEAAINDLFEELGADAELFNNNVEAEGIAFGTPAWIAMLVIYAGHQLHEHPELFGGALELALQRVIPNENWEMVNNVVRGITAPPNDVYELIRHLTKADLQGAWGASKDLYHDLTDWMPIHNKVPEPSEPSKPKKPFDPNIPILGPYLSPDLPYVEPVKQYPYLGDTRSPILYNLLDNNPHWAYGSNDEVTIFNEYGGTTIDKMKHSFSRSRSLSPVKRYPYVFGVLERPRTPLSDKLEFIVKDKNDIYFRDPGNPGSHCVMVPNKEKKKRKRVKGKGKPNEKKKSTKLPKNIFKSEPKKKKVQSLKILPQNPLKSIPRAIMDNRVRSLGEQKLGEEMGPSFNNSNGAHWLSTTDEGNVHAHRMEPYYVCKGQTLEGVYTDVPHQGYINPGFSFIWLQNMAHLYEKYRFNSLKFHYINRVGTFINGNLVMYFDGDSMDVVSDLSEMKTNQPSVNTPVSSSATLTVPKEFLNVYKDLWIRALGTTLPDNADVHLYDPGRILIGTTEVTTSTPAAYDGVIGEIYVEYDVELLVPHVPSTPSYDCSDRWYAVSETQSGPFGGGNGYWFSTKTHSSPTHWRYKDTNEMYIDCAGQWICIIEIVGTGITSIDLTISSYGAYTQIIEEINAGQTYGVSVVLLTTYKNNQCGLGVTATTVTQTEFRIADYRYTLGKNSPFNPKPFITEGDQVVKNKLLEFDPDNKIDTILDKQDLSKSTILSLNDCVNMFMTKLSDTEQMFILQSLMNQFNLKVDLDVRDSAKLLYKLFRCEKEVRSKFMEKVLNSVDAQSECKALSGKL